MTNLHFILAFAVVVVYSISIILFVYLDHDLGIELGLLDEFWSDHADHASF